MNKEEQLKRLICKLYRQDEPEDYTDECMEDMLDNIDFEVLLQAVAHSAKTVYTYPQVVEITRNDTGETIYKSGAIPVGSKIEKAKLSADLDAGTYECTALFYNVDPDTGDYLGCAGAIITITVLD